MRLRREEFLLPECEDSTAGSHRSGRGNISHGFVRWLSDLEVDQQGMEVQGLPPAHQARVRGSSTRCDGAIRCDMHGGRCGMRMGRLPGQAELIHAVEMARQLSDET